MREQARVLDVRDGKAKVEVQHRGGSCCSGCSLCEIGVGGRRVMELTAPPDVHVGDAVTLEVPTRSVLAGVLVLMVIPLVLLVAGVFAGVSLWSAEGRDGAMDLPAFGLGFLLMAVWYAGIWLVERKRRAKPAEQPRIVQVHHSSAG